MMRRTACRLVSGGTGQMGRAWTVQSENFDPRVAYADQPWESDLKMTTGMSGVAVDHRWRKKLVALYTTILHDLKMIPEDNVYRINTENIYREFLRIVSNVGDNDWRIVERKIGLGQVEQLIFYAMDERELVQNYAEWKLWLIPVETVREICDEHAIDIYAMENGGPEPYLSDEEINDMKKIDQQRMAEEQKHIQSDLKKIAGRTSRMLIDDAAARKKKRDEYRMAVNQYIRETQLDSMVTIASDGSVRGDTYGNQKKVQTPDIAGEGVHPTDLSSYDIDPAKKHAAITDWKETMYWSKFDGVSDGAPGDTEGALPARLYQWDAEQGGNIRLQAASDVPHSAPISGESRPRGKKIPKWNKSELALKRGEDVPAMKE
eukprot:TRINITY_DN15804_c0_g1_i1.p1 TRINITY_DN15804_c0_g1~~TRINITY_DN15804_c0_g1_i1.p1  ORF type:complete len:376 (+),score=104.81 TRINITY_DN15804_c0_g1_i1:97-1224(+)